LITAYDKTFLYYYKTTNGVLYSDIKKKKYALRQSRGRSASIENVTIE